MKGADSTKFMRKCTTRGNKEVSRQRAETAEKVCNISLESNSSPSNGLSCVPKISSTYLLLLLGLLHFSSIYGITFPSFLFWREVGYVSASCSQKAHTRTYRLVSLESVANNRHF